MLTFCAFDNSEEEGIGCADALNCDVFGDGLSLRGDCVVSGVGIEHCLTSQGLWLLAGLLGDRRGSFKCADGFVGLRLVVCLRVRLEGEDLGRRSSSITSKSPKSSSSSSESITA